jgi:transposase
MSLQPTAIPPVPEETARVARIAFPTGALAIDLRDQLGTIYEDELFADLFPTRGQPAEAPWRLALVTVLQFVEGLSDRQAAQAVRRCIDWKYAVSLDLTDPGFHYSVLSEFRARLLAGQAEQRLLTALLNLLKQRGWLKGRGRQRTDSTHVLAAVRTLNRLELVGETLRHTLNVLAEVAPTWLRAQAPAAWYDRYSRRIEDYRLPPTKAERDRYGEQIGADGQTLLKWVDQAQDLPWLRDLPAVALLRQVWEQQYCADAATPDQLCWRDNQTLLAPGGLVVSPYDPEATCATKRKTLWTGYKVHLTETCDDEGPLLITDVQTTDASLPDVAMLQPIEHILLERDLLPAQHLVDAGYTEADWVVGSQQQLGVEVVGPVRPNSSWQARTGGYDVTHFRLDWQAQEAICPQGHRSASWTAYRDRWEKNVVSVKFSRRDCLRCPVRARCTQSAGGVRQLTVRAQAAYEALVRVREQHRTLDWQTRYHRRAGVEGLISQGVRIADLRHARYLGLPKVQLQHLATAVALNLVRLLAWLNEVPRTTTRQSRFAALALAS